MAVTRMSRTHSSHRASALAVFRNPDSLEEPAGAGWHGLRFNEAAVRTADGRLKKHRISSSDQVFGSALGCGPITCFGGGRDQLVHVGFGIVIGDRCCLVDASTRSPRNCNSGAPSSTRCPDPLKSFSRPMAAQRRYPADAALGRVKPPSRVRFRANRTWSQHRRMTESDPSEALGVSRNSVACTTVRRHRLIVAQKTATYPIEEIPR